MAIWELLLGSVLIFLAEVHDRNEVPMTLKYVCSYVIPPFQNPAVKLKCIMITSGKCFLIPFPSD